jgi:hypothetical protein
MLILHQALNLFHNSQTFLLLIPQTANLDPNGQPSGPNQTFSNDLCIAVILITFIALLARLCMSHWYRTHSHLLLIWQH